MRSQELTDGPMVEFGFSFLEFGVRVGELDGHPRCFLSNGVFLS